MTLSSQAEDEAEDKTMGDARCSRLWVIDAVDLAKSNWGFEANVTGILGPGASEADGVFWEIPCVTASEVRFPVFFSTFFLVSVLLFWILVSGAGVGRLPCSWSSLVSFGLLEDSVSKGVCYPSSS